MHAQIVGAVLVANRGAWLTTMQCEVETMQMYL